MISMWNPRSHTVEVKINKQWVSFHVHEFSDGIEITDAYTTEVVKKGKRRAIRRKVWTGELAQEVLDKIYKAM